MSKIYSQKYYYLIIILVLLITGYYFLLHIKKIALPLPTVEKVIPPASSKSQNEITNWKTYRNEKYGFEFKYPENFGTIIGEHIYKGCSDCLSDESTLRINFPNYDPQIEVMKKSDFAKWVASENDNSDSSSFSAKGLKNALDKIYSDRSIDKIKDFTSFLFLNYEPQHPKHYFESNNGNIRGIHFLSWTLGPGGINQGPILFILGRDKNGNIFWITKSLTNESIKEFHRKYDQTGIYKYETDVNGFSRRLKDTNGNWIFISPNAKEVEIYIKNNIEQDFKEITLLIAEMINTFKFIK